MNKITENIYRAMDSFLTESKDQNGNERSLERLNQDRHLFVKEMQNIIVQSHKKAWHTRWGFCNHRKHENK